LISRPSPDSFKTMRARDLTDNETFIEIPFSGRNLETIDRNLEHAAGEGNRLGIWVIVYILLLS